MKRNKIISGLVSIVSPAYNSGNYIQRLLDSVLHQTYPSIEMIVVDDGSDDNTSEIVKGYIDKFKSKGYKLKYIYQKNKGQSFAINRGLKEISGEYFLWPDSDDYYSSDSIIEIMVNEMKSLPDDFGVVRVLYRALDENSKKEIDIPSWNITDYNRYKTHLFNDVVLHFKRDFWIVPGGYMIKMKAFDDVVENRTIHASRYAGQNFQIMLPVFYKYKVFTIQSKSYSVVIHPDSHSRSLSTYKKRMKVNLRILIKTLKSIPMDANYRKYIIKKFKEEYHV